ncbi:hypothetical protein ABK040_013325 [Willaertia magna]
MEVIELEANNNNLTENNNLVDNTNFLKDNNNNTEKKEIMMQKVCIMGASGETGRRLTRLLIQHVNNVGITIIGRSLTKLDEVKNNAMKALETIVDKETFDKRLFLKQVDVEQVLKGNEQETNTFEEILKEHSLIINVMPPLPHDETIRLARLAIKNNVDWIDPHMVTSTIHHLKEIEKEAVDNKICIVCQAGLFPGIPALFVRKANENIKEMTDAPIALISRTNHMGLTAGAYDIVDYMKTAKNDVMIDGKWQADKSISRNFHFQSVNKTFACYPMGFEEMYELNIPTLKNTGVFMSELNLLSDLVMLVMQMSAKSFPGFARWMVKNLACAIKYVKEPYVAGAQVEATNKDGDRYYLSICNEDVFEITAHSLVATIEQMLESRTNEKLRKHGVHFSAIYSDPTLLINSLKRQGIPVIEKLNDKDL